MHEAFVKLWRKRDEVQLETVKSLLYKIVQNLALNELRRRRVRELIRFTKFWSDDDAPTAEAQLIAGQDLVVMRKGLEALPIELREVLLLAQFSDLTYAEIAVNLGIPEGTVASRKNRAMLWLRNFQKDSIGGSDE